mgnify:CR=1 FL=1|tara:strand:+ start:55 stop:243 length:189 start_codon:yes stop_codon:yes gene_type:complete
MKDYIEKYILETNEYRHITLPNGDILVIKFDEEGIVYDRYNHNLEEHIESYGYDLYEEIKII